VLSKRPDCLDQGTQRLGFQNETARASRESLTDQFLLKMGGKNENFGLGEESLDSPQDL
jgi:hypothetical protein